MVKGISTSDNNEDLKPLCTVLSLVTSPESLIVMGLVVGIFGVILGLVLSVQWWMKKKREQRQRENNLNDAEMMPIEFVSVAQSQLYISNAVVV